MVFLGSVGFLTAFQREFRLSGGAWVVVTLILFR